MTADKLPAHPTLSKLVLLRGYAWGWAFIPDHATVDVHLYVDGKHVASELTGQTLPKEVVQRCGAPPPRSHSGFRFPLPRTVNDGFEHTVQAALPQVYGGLYGAVVALPAGHARGEVGQRGRQLAGTVWFSKPSSSTRLRITDYRGKLQHSRLLKPLKTADQNGYPARFAVSIDELGAGPYSVCCGEQELRGSPLNPAEFVVGTVEQVDRRVISGWAFSGLDLLKPIELALRIDGKAVRWFRPNILRTDLQKHLLMPAEAMGIAGFAIAPPAVLFDGYRHLVEIVAASSGQLLTDGQHWVTWPGNGRRYIPAPAVIKTKPVRFPHPEVSVVILNRNGAKVLAGMLESWSRYNTSIAAELIVIDHASSDDSLALLKRWRHRLDLKVVALKVNDSFSASCNRGAKLARGNHLLFLNNDIQWLHDALPRMLESLQDPSVGIVGLKLLKVVGESQSSGQHVSEVQHLGVRFKLNSNSYWPYEIAPEAGIAEEEYSPQDVPAVTGAALLCRKDDFETVGGFHTDYFYGFEDVELCLRLATRLNKRVICRNDCTALHYHGHTRLSGRERSIFDRLQRNSSVLESHTGLWIKQMWWRSLLSGDGFFTREPLRIGLIGKAHELAPSLSSTMPHASISLLEPGDNWKDIPELHVLVVGDLYYDIRSMQSRADLYKVAWVKDDHDAWAALAWCQDFDAFVAPTRKAGKLESLLEIKVHASSATAPLGTLLDANATHLRVAVCADPADKDCQRQASRFMKSLRQQGAICWLAESADVRVRVTDVCVTLSGKATQRVPAIAVTQGVLQISLTVKQPLPLAAWLVSELEKQVGSTFQSS
jgi:GT2 family glycosyltransferase